MAASSPINWQTIEDAIYTWFSGQTGLTTIWGNQTAPRPAYPYAVINIISGPTKEGGVDEWRYSTDLTKARNVKVTPIAANATTYTVQINGTDFDYLSDADATVAEITAGLTSAVNLGSEPVTATDNGTDLDLVGDNSVVFTLVVSDDGGGADLLSWVNNDVGAEVLNDVTGYREITLSCQVLVRLPNSNDPTMDAKKYMSIAQSTLGVPPVLLALRTAGISVISEGGISDISAEVADEIESRAQMDVRFRIVSSLVGERTGYLAGLSTTTGTFDGSIDSPIVEDFTP